jgi:DNA-directed RNA polymerase alpha subunit
MQGRCVLLSNTYAQGEFICPPSFGCERYSPDNPFIDRQLWQVDEINLGVRALNVCLACGITTLRQLTETSAKRLRLAKQCGSLTVARIRQELAKIGLDLEE